MKNLLCLYIIILFLLFTGCFQENVESLQLEKRDRIVYRIGEKKPFSGVIKNYYSNGKLKVEYSYKNGKLHGKYKEYFEDGKPAKEIEF